MRQLAHQGGATVHCHKLRYPANDNKGFQSGPVRRAVDRGSAVARSGGLLGGSQPAPPGGRDRPVPRTRVLRPHRAQPLCHRHRDLLVCRRAGLRHAHSRRRGSRLARGARCDPGGRHRHRLRPGRGFTPRSDVEADRAPGVARLGLGRGARVPGALVVILASILASPWLAAHGVALTGPIHLALAMPAFALPSGTGWLPLTEFAFALMFILYAESYGSIRTFRLKHRRDAAADRDLLAVGAGHVMSGLFQGTPVGAGYSGTAANAAAGAQSRFAGLFAAGIVLVLVLLFLRWIERIPEPVLAAIVIHAVSKSLRVSVFRDYFRWQRDRLGVGAGGRAGVFFRAVEGVRVGG